MNIRHDFPYDPAGGLSREELLMLAAPPESPGFRKFWEETHSLAMEHKPYYYIEREVWSGQPDCRIYVVRAKTWDNREIVMWISRPRHSRGGILIGQEYCNMSVPPPCDAGVTLCCPNVRGLGLSQCRDIPWVPPEHVLHGIRAKETYVLRGVITDLWLAATILIDMYPDVAENLNYMGSGMGGGTGALMLPWDSRFKAAFLGVPAFGNNPVCLKYQSPGYGEALGKYVQEHPEAMEVLGYFDAAVSAKYLRIPTVVVPALSDPCVAPAGQFSVANSIPDRYRIRFIAETGHGAGTERDSEIYGAAEKKRLELFGKQAPRIQE